MDDRNSQRPRWYIARTGEKQGPLTLSAIVALAENDAIEPDDLVWRPGFLAWIEAGQVPGLLIPPPLPEAIAGPAKSDKPAVPPAAKIGQSDAKPVSPSSPRVGQAPTADAAPVSLSKPMPNVPASQPAAKGKAKAGVDPSARDTLRGPQVMDAPPPAEGMDETKLRALRAKLIDTIERQQH